MAREFIDGVDDGKVAIGVRDENGENGFVQSFDTYEEIEQFAKDNPDLPEDIRESALAAQLQLNKQRKAPVFGPTEAKYAIAARHTQLENMIVAGTKPTKEYYESLAKQDKADYAKLDEQGRKVVQEDMGKAVLMSKEYAEGVRDVGLDSEAHKDLTVGGEDLDEVRKRLAANFVAPLEEEEEKERKSSTNQVILRRAGAELAKGAFIKPISLARDYEELGLEYRMKSNSLAFRMSEAGNSLHTTTPDKKIIEDMIALAKAKNWTNIKLAGSQEFRREAWLQAESQGIKTMGYTPRAEDKEILEALRKQRRENSITNLDQQEKTAPRTVAHASESVKQANARMNTTEHLLALTEQAGYKNRNLSEVSKIAELRSMFVEDRKQEGIDGDTLADELVKFDKHFENPKNLEEVLKKTEALNEHKLPERKPQENELSR